VQKAAELGGLEGSLRIAGILALTPRHSTFRAASFPAFSAPPTQPASLHACGRACCTSACCWPATRPGD
jgi:hypothetical protein